MTPFILFFIIFVLAVLRHFWRWVCDRPFPKSCFKHIPGPPAESWFKGNLGQLFNSKGLAFHRDIVDVFGGMVKVYGFLGDQQLYVSDPRALQTIVNDQDAFEETAVFIETNKAIFGPGLVATTGKHHKAQRKIVNPIFSVPQLRHLTPIIYSVAERLTYAIQNEVLRNQTASGESVLDIFEWMSRVALETVGQTVLGYSFDPLTSPHSNPYTSAVKELIPTMFSLSLVRQFAPFLSKLGAPSFRRMVVEWTPNQAVQKVKNISDIMHNTAQEILRSKVAAITGEHKEDSAEPACAKDLISVLLRANKKVSNSESLSDAELTGQMTVLIFGAQDTTSSALSRILYMLSKHPKIQDNVRNEVREKLRERQAQGDTSGRLCYDEVTSLPLLDAVIKETLRLYPPVSFVRRTTIKERTVSYSSGDSKDSAGLSSVTIPVGTTIFISIAGSNRLKSVWGPDAKQWKPARWLGGAPASVRLPGIYGGTMSFLGGGRSCVGYKFAQVEMKIILSVLLTNFEFSLVDERIVWNLSQIISPSVQRIKKTFAGDVVEEQKGLPLRVCPVRPEI